MKRLILSIAVIFSAIASANAQEISLPNLGGSCYTDLIFGEIGTLPATAYPGDVISFEVEIINTNNDCLISQSVLRVYTGIGGFEVVDVVVPNFHYQNSHVVTVNYTVPPHSSGQSIYVTAMTLDYTNNVNETNENNNMVLSTPILPTIIL